MPLVRFRIIATGMLLVSALATGVRSAQPSRMHFQAATLVEIDSAATYYQYTLETADRGFIVRSPRRLYVTEGARVEFAIAGSRLYLKDQDGNAHETFYMSRSTCSPVKLNRKSAAAGSVN